jgi:hypothetical protein
MLAPFQHVGIAAAYAWVTGSVFFIRRMKPPIAYLLAFGGPVDIWVRRIPKGQYKAIQGSIDGFRITAACGMGNRRGIFYAAHEAAYSVFVGVFGYGLIFGVRRIPTENITQK